MPFARLNGIALHYHDTALEADAADVREGGQAARRALVFANSLGTDFRIWDGVVARLNGQFRVIRYDKRGHGLSDATPGPYAMDTHVDDLIALLDHVDAQKIVVCGLSVGGVIAQGLAARQPQRISALILCDTGAKIGTDELWNSRIDAVTTNGIAAIADAILERWFSKAYRVPENADFAGYRNMLVRTTVEGYAGTSAALRDSDLTASTRMISVPALCIVGDEDGATPPEMVEGLAGLIAGARFEIIEGAGHLPCIEKPDEFARLVLEFANDKHLI